MGSTPLSDADDDVLDGITASGYSGDKPGLDFLQRARRLCRIDGFDVDEAGLLDERRKTLAKASTQGAGEANERRGRYVVDPGARTVAPAAQGATRISAGIEFEAAGAADSSLQRSPRAPLSFLGSSYFLILFFVEFAN
jgi:hypothetical protein